MQKIGYFILAMVLAFGNVGFSFSDAATFSCDDVRFVFARGSGEQLGDVSATEWQAQIEKQLSHNRTLRHSFYELGNRAQDGPYGVAQYPAVAVAGSVGDTLNLVGAAVSGGEAFQFGTSVNEGMRELKNYIENTAASCPETRFVLGGYSQGAMIISQSLPTLDANKILYAATFGDPKVYLPEGKGIFPAACAGKDLSEYRRNVADCHAYEGVLGSQQPYQPTNFSGKVGVWCNKDDLMCSSKWSLSDHTGYVSDGMYAEAAEYIAKILQQEYPDLIIVDWQKSASTKHNVVFLIDSTGSMMNSIDRYRNEAKHLAREVINIGGRIALFEFRDLADPFMTVQHCDLACDYNTFVEKLDGITVEDGGGGDEKESTLSAMLYAMNNVDWQDGANKSMVVLTDGGYLNPDRDETTLERVVRRSLEIDPVNAYFISGSEYKYIRLAEQMGGEVFNEYGDLSKLTKLILERPVARLSQTEYFVPLHGEANFDATGSYEIVNGEKNQAGLTFDWDLNGDGRFEYLNVGPTIKDVFHYNFDGFAQVRVKSSQGYQSTMSARLVVGDEGEVAPATIHSASTNLIGAGAAQVEFVTNAKRVLISVNDAILGYMENKNAGISQTLSLYDLPESARLTLVPYDKDNRRGTSYNLVIAEKSQEPSNDKNPANDSNLDKWQNSALEKPTSASQAREDEKRKVPLAPNAGVGPKNR